MPWALIGAACLASFAATSSGTTRAPFLLEISRDLGVSMPLVANLVSMTATAWGITSAVGGWLSDRFGRRSLLIVAPFALASRWRCRLSPTTSRRSRLGDGQRRLVPASSRA